MRPGRMSNRSKVARRSLAERTGDNIMQLNDLRAATEASMHGMAMAIATSSTGFLSRVPQSRSSPEGIDLDPTYAVRTISDLVPNLSIGRETVGSLLHRLVAPQRRTVAIWASGLAARAHLAGCVPVRPLPVGCGGSGRPATPRVTPKRKETQRCVRQAPDVPGG